MIDKGFSFLFIDRVNILDALVHAWAISICSTFWKWLLQRLIEAF